VVDSFVYLGSYITKDNDEYIEIQRRLKLPNKAYLSLLAVMRCKDIHKETKVMLYKTLIRTVFTYGSETWMLFKNSENALSTFERKILRRIYGPVQDNGQWRIRYNKELYELYGEPDLVTCIKLRRLQWAGHVQRMEGTRIPTKEFKAKFEGVRSVGKSRKRWEDVVQQDATCFLLCRNWKLAASDRTLWRQKIEEAKARFGL
jgi:hypothetical protein